VTVRIGILTDIHGDYETMSRVLACLEAQRVDRLVCLGDLVVHGPAPNAVVDWFRQQPEVLVVKGNHDIGATIADEHLDSLHFFSPDSRDNTHAARLALTEENKAYLQALPLEVREAGVCYTHAARGNPFAILRKPETIAKSFDTLDAPLLFTGHTHRTRIHHWPADKTLWCTHHPTETKHWVTELVPEDRYIIHVGCTAQLKYDPHPPVCAVFEPANLRLEFHELPDLRG
jgi:predicted phosphodiesterase